MMIEYTAEGVTVLLLMFSGAAWFAVSRVLHANNLQKEHAAAIQRKDASQRGPLIHTMGRCPTCSAEGDEECTYRGLNGEEHGCGPARVHVKRNLP